MDNKQIKNIKEEKIKSFYKAIHKTTKLDSVLSDNLDIKIKRNNGQKLTRKRKQHKKTMTKKK